MIAAGELPGCAVGSSAGNCAQELLLILLSRALTQPVDFREVMSAREQLFWNSTLEQLLLACADEAAVKAVFARLAGVPALQVSRLKRMRQGLQH